MDFSYDPAGNRVSKKAGDVTTFYVRDAQRNPLAIYDNAGSAINWKEQQLYGSSRLGTWKPNITVSGGGATSIWDSLGRKQYELSNHLGNVMAVINDKRSFDGSVYTSQQVLGRDYYSFGSLMSERKLGSYRYGFNGKENDNDVKGEGNQQDYGMRIYDPRVGRFFSVDPITREYPELTPYQFASNTPIRAIDLDGLEMKDVNDFAYYGEDAEIRKQRLDRANKDDGHKWLLYPLGAVMGAALIIESSPFLLQYGPRMLKGEL